MRAYSMDLRERALLDSDAGMKAADVAAKYRVSGSWVRRLKQRRRDTGEVAPRVQRQGRRGMLEPHLHTLAALIAAHPDRTLAELKDALATPASVPTVWRAVRALGLTVKKNGPPVRTRSAGAATASGANEGLELRDVPHGFRSSFRDWAAEQTNTPREVVEAALAHTVRNPTEAAYARSDLFERRRRLMNDWAGYLNG